jgi:hypothetical protein
MLHEPDAIWADWSRQYFEFDNRPGSTGRKLQHSYCEYVGNMQLILAWNSADWLDIFEV